MAEAVIRSDKIIKSDFPKQVEVRTPVKLKNLNYFKASKMTRLELFEADILRKYDELHTN